MYSALGIVREAARRLSPRWQKTKVWRKAWRWVASPGTIEVEAKDAKSGKTVRTKVDYRSMGSRPGIPKEFDESATTVVEGIRLYKATGLIDRKLQALMGPSRRVAARDGFDAVVLRWEHQDKLTREQITGIDRWMEAHGPESERWTEWARACSKDPVMAGIGWKGIWDNWNKRKQKEKETTQERRAERSRGRAAQEAAAARTAQGRKTRRKKGIQHRDQ